MKAPNNPRHLWFERAGTRFAAPMSHLQEVLSSPRIHPIPAVEPALAGLMILREEVIPVFDPAFLRSSELSREISSPVVIVLGVQGKPLLGLLAEKVGKVIDLPATKPLTSPARISAAFSGDFSSPGSPPALVLDAMALANAMGLIQTADHLTQPDSIPDNQSGAFA